MGPGPVAARFIAPTLNAYRSQSRIRPCSQVALTPMPFCPISQAPLLDVRPSLARLKAARSLRPIPVKRCMP